MSAKTQAIAILSIAAAAFLGLGAVLDRDLVFLPFHHEAKRQERETPAILASLPAYNAILTDIYVTNGDPKMLNELPATKAMRHDLYRDIGYIREHQQVLIYDMAKLTPVSIRLTSPRTADAVVFEEWNYEYQRASDRVPASRMKGIGQGYLYRLTEEGGAWIISSWDPVAVADPVLAQQPQ